MTKRPQVRLGLVLGATLGTALTVLGGSFAMASPPAGADAGSAKVPGFLQNTASIETTNDDSDSSAVASSVAGERELGARLGAAMGTGLSPGGVRLAGLMLYRMSQADWFEGNLGFTFGRNQAGCFSDRGGTFTCDHGVVDGAGIDLTVGVRRFLRPRQGFVPYLRAGLGLRLSQFRSDELRGVAVPAIFGAGVRAQVNRLVSVGADIGADAALGWYERGLGINATLGLAIQVSAEFRLD